MRSVKRIEILTGVQELPLVERVLERHGITGYTVSHDVQGKGDRRLDSVDFLTGEPESLSVKTTCPPDAFDGLVEALRPILTRYGGACVAYDAECIILSHHYDPKAGGMVWSET
jgi:hypothetical protein